MANSHCLLFKRGKITQIDSISLIDMDPMRDMRKHQLRESYLGIGTN